MFLVTYSLPEIQAPVPGIISLQVELFSLIQIDIFNSQIIVTFKLNSKETLFYTVFYV